MVLGIPESAKNFWEMILGIPESRKNFWEGVSGFPKAAQVCWEGVSGIPKRVRNVIFYDMYALWLLFFYVTNNHNTFNMQK